MNWNMISAASDFLGAIAVVISLIYIAKQLRDSKDEILLETTHTTTQGLNDFYMSIAQGADVSRIYHQGNRDPLSLDKEHFQRYMILISCLFGLCSDIYIQQKKEHIVSIVGILC